MCSKWPALRLIQKTKVGIHPSLLGDLITAHACNKLYNQQQNITDFLYKRYFYPRHKRPVFSHNQLLMLRLLYRCPKRYLLLKFFSTVNIELLSWSVLSSERLHHLACCKFRLLRNPLAQSSVCSSIVASFNTLGPLPFNLPILVVPILF